MIDTRIQYRTSRNFAKTATGSLKVGQDYTDLEQILANAGFTGSIYDLEKAALGYAEDYTVEQVRSAFAYAAKKAAAKIAEAAAQEAAAKETAAQAANPTWRHRVLYAEAQTPAATIVVDGETLSYTGSGKAFRISEDAPSLHGAHLLGHEGAYGAYAYYR